MSLVSNGDKVLLSAHTSELKKYGWKANTSNLPSSYLVGLLLGLKAKKKEINEAILDLGLQPSIKGTALYAAMKGAIDGGLNVPCSEKIMPKEDRIKGIHISNYAKLAKGEGPHSSNQICFPLPSNYFIN